MRHGLEAVLVEVDIVGMPVVAAVVGNTAVETYRPMGDDPVVL